MSKKVTSKTATSLYKKSDFDQVNANFSENALRMMKKRYLQKKSDGTQESPAEMFQRIAHALAKIEKNYGKNDKFVEKTEREFFDIMSRKEYTPAGRTITNAGADTPVVANCIVLPIHDSMDSIFQTLKDAALLQQAGSGLGFDFSHLRPAMTPTKKSNGVASGPVSFLRVYNEAFGVIKQQGRHGANMAMMQIDHPDVLDFIRAKEIEGDIRNFNISIKVTDEFMKAVTEKPNEQWYCNWNGKKVKPQRVLRSPSGSVTGVEEMTVTAGEIFDELIHYAWLNGEPGIVFIDEVNRTNPLPGLGPIDCSNPCGEQFLHHYDNCNLGSINLAMFVKDKKMDWTRLRQTTAVATRLMDNVIDTFDFPVKQVTELAQKNRRIGLGIMGFADMLYQLDIAYNSPEGVKLGEKVMQVVTDASHKASEKLAKEKGAFPNIKLSVFDKKRIKMRNAALTTVAPTGSISMMFDCSSGIEPNFALTYVKQDKDGTKYHYFNEYFEKAIKKAKLKDAKVKEIRETLLRTGSIQTVEDIPENLKKTFIVAMDISADDHLKMQAAFQKNVDNSISKTINFPNEATHEEVRDGFIAAWKYKCKACTVYRDGSRNVQILNLGTGEGLKAPSEIGKNGVATPTPSIKTTIAPQGLEDLRERAEQLVPRDRPEVMVGKTYQVKTGYGKLYTTINNDDQGQPFEVFATIGKSGGFFQEQSEGICRLISLALRAGIAPEEVIHHLKGIRGPMPTMTNKGTIYSLPDALGQILEQHIKAGDNLKTESEQIESQEAVLVNVQEKTEETISYYSKKKSIAHMGMMPGCPDCGSALQLQEGCMSCRNCGFSRCS
ncbi:MAG: adenosylcobalamin-dependent ribonucleoside-diphosphate reductase [Anaplasmataceae bacterium]|nr:adenosylcobalamin-dependent ribonucleoside-diphosphate reductase [Anaplasmataceae bacterium]